MGLDRLGRYSHATSSGQDKSLGQMEAEAWENTKRSPGRFAQGMATGMLGFPVDVVNMAAGALGLGSETPVGGMRHLGQLIGADEASMLYMAGQMTPWNPAAAARRAATLASSPAGMATIGGLAALHGVPGIEAPLMVGVVKQKGGNRHPSKGVKLSDYMSVEESNALRDAHFNNPEHFATGGSVNTYDKWSDEQLKEYIKTGQAPDASAKYNTPPLRAEHTAEPRAPGMGVAEAGGFAALEGEPWYERARMGAGKQFADIGAGVSDLAQLTFAPRGKPGDEVRSRIMADRQERELRDRALSQDPAAIGGGMAAQLATAVSAPARLPAQVALEAGIAGLQQPKHATSGIGSELFARGLQAGEVGGLTFGVGKGVQALGKIGGAATGQYTDAGAEAMALRDAAQKDLGVHLRVADLDPNSAMGVMERGLPGRGADIRSQAAALRPHVDATVEVPSLSGRSYTTRNAPGEGLRLGVVEAADNLRHIATGKWTTLDDYVTTNGLTPIALGKTSLASRNVSDNALDLVGDYNPQVASWLGGLRGMPAQQIGHIPFAPMNEMRMAIGKAVGKVSRDFEKLPATSPERAAARTVREELNNLYRLINTDLEAWGTKNVKNTEAFSLFKNANDFYRDRIVPDIINNPVVSKAAKGVVAGGNPKGFKDSADIINSVVRHPEVVDRLRDSMSPKTSTLVDTLRSAEDARSFMSTGNLPSSDLKVLGSLAGTMLGHPVTAIGELASRIPGLKALSQSRPVAGLHFAKDLTEGSPLGRAAYGLAQYPREQLQDNIDYALGND